MSDDPDDTPLASARARILQRISDALGCPVAAFYTAEGRPPVLAERYELMALWDALRTDAGRRAALETVRAIVEAE